MVEDSYANKSLLAKGKVYLYLGSTNSAHYSYISSFDSSSVNIRHFERSLLAYFKLAYCLLFKYRNSMLISSSALIVSMARLLGREVIFDCHGRSRALILLRYFVPTVTISNSIGTQRYLRKYKLISRVYEPSQLFPLSDVPSVSSVSVEQRIASIGLLVAGEVSRNCDLSLVAQMCCAKFGADKLTIHVFSRDRLVVDPCSRIDLNIENYGYRGLEEIQRIAQNCQFGLICYDRSHSQRIFMSPLKGELYVALGLHVIAPSWLPALRRLSYSDVIFFFNDCYELRDVWVPVNRSRRLLRPEARYQIGGAA